MDAKVTRTQKKKFGESVGFHVGQLSKRHDIFLGFGQKSKQFWEPFAWENAGPLKEGLRKLEASDF